ncbi:MAG: hypothetical protein V4617_13210 [Gemmatimonadota bacterium]
MHRSPLRRFLTALWGCWFVLLVNEPLLLHACPMHDGALAAATGAMAHGAATPSDHGAHGQHAPAPFAVNASESAPSAPAQHDQGGSHHCSCLGHCASATAIALPERKAFAWLAGIIDVDDVPVLAVQNVSRDVEHLLPFATAPPVVTRA